MSMKTKAEWEAELIARVMDDEDFRAFLLENPKEAIRQASGIDIPDDFTVRVHEDDGTTTHLVLPPSDHLTQADLELVAGGTGGNGWYFP